MIFLSANNARTTLAGSISSSATTIILASGMGALFPSPTTGRFFSVTLNDAATRSLYEICYCTSRTGDNLTVTRGQEGTAARAWTIGDYAYRTLTAAQERQLAQYQLIPHTGPVGIAASTTVTIPANVYWFYFKDAVAGGGGGGGSYGAMSGGSGGSASPAVDGGFPVSPGDVIGLTVGSAGNGGAGGVNPPTTGANGGVTQITQNGTAVLTIAPGQGGLPASGGLQTSVPPAGTVTYVGPTVTTSIRSGVAGGTPYNVGGGGIASAVGGAPGNGSYSATGVQGTATNGQSAPQYGGGGGGGILGGNGGNGGAGFLAYWF